MSLLLLFCRLRLRFCSELSAFLPSLLQNGRHGSFFTAEWIEIDFGYDQLFFPLFVVLRRVRPSFSDLSLLVIRRALFFLLNPESWGFPLVVCRYGIRRAP